MRRMILEPVTQSEVSQKEKDKYCILTHIYGIWKKGPEEFTAGQPWRSRHREQTCGHGERGGEGETHGERNMETYIQFSSVQLSHSVMSDSL